MLNTLLPMNDALDQYLADNSLRGTDILRRLREETESHSQGRCGFQPAKGNSWRRSPQAYVVQRRRPRL